MRDPLGHHFWNGNDQMILGYMCLQMFTAEMQYIASYPTSVDAYIQLCMCHEKHSGMMQIQLIQ